MLSPIVGGPFDRLPLVFGGAVMVKFFLPTQNIEVEVRLKLIIAFIFDTASRTVAWLAMLALDVLPNIADSFIWYGSTGTVLARKLHTKRACKRLVVGGAIVGSSLRILSLSLVGGLTWH